MSDGLTEVEREILLLVERSGSQGLAGRSQQMRDLQTKFGPREVLAAQRALLGAKRVQLVRVNDGGEYKLTVPQVALTDGSHHVLAAIRAAGNSGVDAVTLCSRTKLPRAEVLKALQTLLQAKSIKETRGFANRAKKLFILAELEPSTEVTGGTFYTEERVLDDEFILGAKREIMQFVRSAIVSGAGGAGAAASSAASSSSAVVRRARVDQIQAWLAQKFPKRLMSVRDVGILCRTLELDGLLQRVSGPEAVAYRTRTLPNGDAAREQAPRPLSVLVDDCAALQFTLGYKAQQVAAAAAGAAAAVAAAAVSQPCIESLYLTSLPCFSCALVEECDPSGKGLINPRTCTYLDAWIAVAAAELADSEKATAAAAGAPAAGGAGSGPNTRRGSPVRASAPGTPLPK
jgi:hypothetical protein